MENTAIAATIAEFESKCHYEGEDIEDTLNALRPYLFHRQAIARHKYHGELTIPALKECNEKMKEILYIPK